MKRKPKAEYDGAGNFDEEFYYLSEFIALEKAKLLAFKREYTARMRGVVDGREDDDFPNFMLPHEWKEQYQAFRNGLGR